MSTWTHTLAGVLMAGLVTVAPAGAQETNAPQQPAQRQAQTPQGTPMGYGMMGGPMMGGGPGGMMMGYPQAGGWHDGMMGMMGGFGAAHMASHIEGHIAFLKAELKITAAQEDAWKGVAEAMRASAANLARLDAGSIGSPATAPTVAQAFDLKERVLTARLENTKRLQAAWSKLEPALSPDQRKAAEQLMVPHLMMM